MREQKQRLRAESRLRRESHPANELREHSRRIQHKALEFPAYRAASAVALYSPLGNEVATEAIRDHALAGNKKLFYPKVGPDKQLNLVQVAGPEELQPGAFGLLEPTGSRVLTREDHDRLIVFVPGLAFDLQGNRLGRGWGWYDRVLGQLTGRASFVALAYEFQILATLPAEKWDRKVHYIITEVQVIDCGQKIAHRAG